MSTRNKSQIMDIMVPSDRMFDIASGEIADPPGYDDIGNKFTNTSTFLGPRIGAEKSPPNPVVIEAFESRLNMPDASPVLKQKIDDIARHNRIHGVWKATIAQSIQDRNPKHPWNVVHAYFNTREGYVNIRVVHPTVGSRAVVSNFTPDIMAQQGYTDVAHGYTEEQALTTAHRQYPESQYLYRIMLVGKNPHVFVKNKASGTDSRPRPATR
jgi:hypothetical protein